jgi:hypothetical protein
MTHLRLSRGRGVYWRETEIGTARATRKWGWPARWAWREFSTEYFQFHREVVFRRSLTSLRNHIVSELNALLKRLGIKAELRIENSPSIEQYETGLRHLAKGEWDFARLREKGLA